MNSLKILLILTIILLPRLVNSQVLINPNYSLKSHETLNIIKIEAKAEATIFYMAIENRIQGGSFCADRNISLLYPDGRKIKLAGSSGIPVCPETYQFKSIGEKLEFVLTFPPVKKGTGWIDLIEECNENCFVFFGICLDGDLNERIDNAFSFAENDEISKAMNSFIAILEEVDNSNNGIEGLLYINIIRLAVQSGDDKKAAEWYRRFTLSEAPRLSQYVKYLNDQGIKY